MKRIGEDLHNIINSQSQLIITNKESDDRSLFSDSDNRGSETESCFSGFDSECDIVTPGYNIDNTHVERYTDTKMDTRKFLGEHCRGNNNITRLITCSENPPNLQDLSFNKRKRDETEALHYDKCADKGGHLCRRKITIVCHTTREKSGRHLRTGGGSRVNTHVECHKINQIPTERIFVNKNQVKDHNSCKIGENKNCVAPHHVTQYLLNPLILNKHNGGNLSNVEANSEKPNFFAINQDARQWVSTDHHQTLQLQSQTSKCTEKKEQCGTLQKVSNEGNGCFRVCIGTGTALQESSEEDGLIPWEDDFMLVPFEAEGTQSPTMFDIVGESNHSEEEISGERTNSCQTLNNKGGNKQLYRSYSSPNRDGHMESSPFIPTIVGPGQLAPNYLRCSPERIGEIGAVEDVITDDSECSRRDDDNIIFQDHSYSANPENHLKCKCISNSARISQENDCCAIVYDSALEVAENVVVPHDKLAEDEFDNCKGRDEGSTEENRNTSDTAVNRSIINCRNNLDEISTMTHVAQSTNSRSVYGKRVVELEQKHPEKSSNSISESGSYMPSVQDLVKRISKEVTVKVIPSVNVSTVSTNDTAKDPKEIKKKDSKMVTSKSDSCTEIDNNLNSTCSMKRKAVSSPEECLQTDFNFEAHSEKFVKMDDNWVVIYSKMSEPQKNKVIPRLRADKNDPTHSISNIKIVEPKRNKVIVTPKHLHEEHINKATSSPNSPADLTDRKAESSPEKCQSRLCNFTPCTSQKVLKIDNNCVLTCYNMLDLQKCEAILTPPNDSQGGCHKATSDLQNLEIKDNNIGHNNLDSQRSKVKSTQGELQEHNNNNVNNMKEKCMDDSNCKVLILEDHNSTEVLEEITPCNLSIDRLGSSDSNFSIKPKFQCSKLSVTQYKKVHGVVAHKQKPMKTYTRKGNTVSKCLKRKRKSLSEADMKKKSRREPSDDTITASRCVPVVLKRQARLRVESRQNNCKATTNTEMGKYSQESNIEKEAIKRAWQALSHQSLHHISEFNPAESSETFSNESPAAVDKSHSGYRNIISHYSNLDSILINGSLDSSMTNESTAYTSENKQNFSKTCGGSDPESDSDSICNQSSRQCKIKDMLEAVELTVTENQLDCLHKENPVMFESNEKGSHGDCLAELRNPKTAESNTDPERVIYPFDRNMLFNSIGLVEKTSFDNKRCTPSLVAHRTRYIQAVKIREREQETECGKVNQPKIPYYDDMQNETGSEGSILRALICRENENKIASISDVNKEYEGKMLNCKVCDSNSEGFNDNKKENEDSSNVTIFSARKKHETDSLVLYRNYEDSIDNDKNPRESDRYKDTDDNLKNNYSISELQNVTEKQTMGVKEPLTCVCSGKARHLFCPVYQKAFLLKNKLKYHSTTKSLQADNLCSSPEPIASMLEQNVLNHSDEDYVEIIESKNHVGEKYRPASLPKDTRSQIVEKINTTQEIKLPNLLQNDNLCKCINQSSSSEAKSLDIISHMENGIRLDNDTMESEVLQHNLGTFGNSREDLVEHITHADDITLDSLKSPAFNMKLNMHHPVLCVSLARETGQELMQSVIPADVQQDSMPCVINAKEAGQNQVVFATSTNNRLDLAQSVMSAEGSHQDPALSLTSLKENEQDLVQSLASAVTCMEEKKDIQATKEKTNVPAAKEMEKHIFMKVKKKVPSEKEKQKVLSAKENVKVSATEENEKLQAAKETEKIQATKDIKKVQTTKENEKFQTTEEIEKAQTTKENGKVQTAEENEKAQAIEENKKVHAINKNEKVRALKCNEKVQAKNEKVENEKFQAKNEKVNITVENEKVQATKEIVQFQATKENENVQTTRENEKAQAVKNKEKVQATKEMKNIKAKKEKKKILANKRKGNILSTRKREKVQVTKTKKVLVTKGKAMILATEGKEKALAATNNERIFATKQVEKVQAIKDQEKVQANKEKEKIQAINEEHIIATKVKTRVPATKDKEQVQGLPDASTEDKGQDPILSATTKEKEKVVTTTTKALCTQENVKVLDRNCKKNVSFKGKEMVSPTKEKVKLLADKEEEKMRKKGIVSSKQKERAFVTKEKQNGPVTRNMERVVSIEENKQYAVLPNAALEDNVQDPLLCAPFLDDKGKVPSKQKERAFVTKEKQNGPVTRNMERVASIEENKQYVVLPNATIKDNVNDPLLCAPLLENKVKVPSKQKEKAFVTKEKQNGPVTRNMERVVSIVENKQYVVLPNAALEDNVQDPLLCAPFLDDKGKVPSKQKEKTFVTKEKQKGPLTRNMERVVSIEENKQYVVLPNATIEDNVNDPLLCAPFLEDKGKVPSKQKEKAFVTKEKQKGPVTRNNERVVSIEENKQYVVLPNATIEDNVNDPLLCAPLLENKGKVPSKQKEKAFVTKEKQKGPVTRNMERVLATEEEKQDTVLTDATVEDNVKYPLLCAPLLEDKAEDPLSYGSFSEHFVLSSSARNSEEVKGKSSTPVKGNKQKPAHFTTSFQCNNFFYDDEEKVGVQISKEYNEESKDMDYISQNTETQENNFLGFDDVIKSSQFNENINSYIYYEKKLHIFRPCTVRLEILKLPYTCTDVIDPSSKCMVSFIEGNTYSEPNLPLVVQFTENSDISSVLNATTDLSSPEKRTLKNVTENSEKVLTEKSGSATKKKMTRINCDQRISDAFLVNFSFKENFINGIVTRQRFQGNEFRDSESKSSIEYQQAKENELKNLESNSNMEYEQAKGDELGNSESNSNMDYQQAKGEQFMKPVSKAEVECQSNDPTPSEPKSKSIKKRLKYNVITKYGRRWYPCDACSHQFASSGDLVRHIRTHSGERPFQCHICARSYVQKSALNKHLDIHLGRKPFVCSTCNMAFTQKAHLVTHQRIHTGEKPFICNECGKSFARLENLKRHLITHSSERPFKCSMCPVAFKCSANLNKHTRIHLEDRRHQCVHCGATFVLAHSLRLHTRTHTGEKPIHCPLCNIDFRFEGSLRKHVKTWHPKFEVKGSILVPLAVQ